MNNISDCKHFFGKWVSGKRKHNKSTWYLKQ